MNTPQLQALFAPDNLKATFSYEEYMVLMETVVREERTTGPKQSPEYAAYTKLNLARIHRLNKTFVPDADTVETVAAIKEKQNWYVLTEAWCGDAAQCLPVIAKIAALNPAISLTMLLRDENPEVMDQYLTNGGKSIPKLIALDQDGNELFNWGPRPAGAQAIHNDYKQNPGRPFSELTEELQRWYNSDKTHSIQSELCAEIKKTL